MSFEGPETHAHPPHGGRHAVDLVIAVAVAVVFVSLLSLGVSINHGRTMEKLVAENEKMVVANTLPFLTMQDSGFTPEGRPRRAIVVSNGGVGPAVVDWFVVRSRGRAETPQDLMRACCEAALRRSRPGDAVFSNMSDTVLPARDSRVILDIRDPAAMTAFQSGRSDLSFEACFCSVLDECWLTDFARARPRRVETCKTPPGTALW